MYHYILIQNYNIIIDMINFSRPRNEMFRPLKLYLQFLNERLFLSLSLSLSLWSFVFGTQRFELRVSASKAIHLRRRIVTCTPSPFLYTSILRATTFSNILYPKLRGRNVCPFYFANFHLPPRLYACKTITIRRYSSVS